MPMVVLSQRDKQSGILSPETKTKLFTIGARGLKTEEIIFCVPHSLQPGFALANFALFSYPKSKLHDPRFSDLDDQRLSTEDIIQKADKNIIKVHFMNVLNDMKSVLN